MDVGRILRECTGLCPGPGGDPTLFFAFDPEIWYKNICLKIKLPITGQISATNNIDYDDVVVPDGRPYLVRNNEREGRFGIEEQQKYWVKRARDLTDGSTKILKLTFHERFEANVGSTSSKILHEAKDCSVWVIK
jgi:hypothetical protein